MALSSTGWVKYASSNIVADQADPAGVAATAPSNLFVCRGYRSARIRFYGDANDVTATFAVYLVYRSTNAEADNPGDADADVMFDTKLAFSLAESTAGTAVGVAGGNAGTGDNYFGTLGAPTISSWATKVLNSVNGIADTYSADNERGELLISDLADADLVIRVTLGTAVSANAEIMLG